MDGVRQTGVVNIDGDNYNLNGDGILRTGWQGGKYHNQYGYPITGWHTLDGGLRYFNENGDLVTNTQMGEYTIDGNGIAHKQLAAPAAGSPSACFSWVRGNMRYASIGDSGYDGNVQYALANKRGACYHYAALLHNTMANSGIGATYVYGTNPQGGRHDWVVVGGTVYDATNNFICSEDEMSAKGYSW